MDSHWVFVAVAYGIAAVTVAGLILKAVGEWRAARRALAALEARGRSRSRA